MSNALSDVARRVVLGAIKYLDEVQACPFCDLGHTIELNDAPETHALECPLRGFERTEDVERLRAWAALRHTEEKI